MNKHFLSLFLTTLVLTTYAMPPLHPCVASKDKPAAKQELMAKEILDQLQQEHRADVQRQIIIKFLTQKNDVTIKNSTGKTLMHLATQMHPAAHHPWLIGVLRIRGADVNSLDDAGKPPLYYAALHEKETGNNQCADLLILNGADISVLQEEKELLDWVAKTKHRLGLNEASEQIIMCMSETESESTQQTRQTLDDSCNLEEPNCGCIFS